MLRLFMIAAGAALLTAPALAQGFDCRKATTSAEHLICGSEDLGMKDRAISNMYLSALRLHPEQRQRITNLQRAFIARRDACTKSAEAAAAIECMDQEYSGQGDALNVLSGRDGSVRPF